MHVGTNDNLCYINMAELLRRSNMQATFIIMSTRTNSTFINTIADAQSLMKDLICNLAEIDRQHLMHTSSLSLSAHLSRESARSQKRQRCVHNDQQSHPARLSLEPVVVLISTNG